MVLKKKGFSPLNIKKKMEQLAQRALTECATLEEVLKLEKEYLDFD